MRKWLRESEQAEAGLLRLCQRKQIEQAFDRFLEGTGLEPELPDLLSACSAEDLQEAAHLLAERATAWATDDESEARARSLILAFAEELRGLSPVSRGVLTTEVEAALASALGLDELLERACGLAMAVARADACFLLLAEDNDRLQMRARLGVEPSEERRLEAELEALVARLLSEGSSELVRLNEKRLGDPDAHRVREAGFRSLLLLPFVARTHSHSLGALVLLAREAAAFGPRIRREMKDFARQATGALENMLLYESAQRRLTEMSDLTWVSGRVASTLDQESIAQTVSRAAANVLSVPRVAIFLADGAGEFYPLAKGLVGFSGAKTQRLPATGHLGAEALASQRPRAVSDAPREDQAEDPLVEWLGATSLLCAPMVGPQGLHGFVAVADDAPRAFSIHMVTLLSTYANQAALALQSAMLNQQAAMLHQQAAALYQRAEQYERRLSRLEQLSEALAAGDPDQTAAVALAAAMELLEAPVGLMWLAKPLGSNLTVKAVQGLSDEELVQWDVDRLRAGEGLAGPAAASRKLLSVSFRDGLFVKRARECGLRREMVAPLVSQGRVVGVLDLFRESEEPVSRDDERVLTSLASSAAVSIENANLAGELRQRSDFVGEVMKTMNHRMRNSLQAVVGLLQMELRRPQARSTEEVVRRAIAHVQAVAAVLEVTREQDVAFVDMKEAAERVRLSFTHDPTIITEVTGTRVLLPSQRAGSVALILAELIDNAIRHGIAGRKDGRITISFADLGREVVLQVHDNGPGVADISSLEESKGLGLRIVRGLVEEELGGTVEFISKNGFTVRARFPKLE